MFGQPDVISLLRLRIVGANTIPNIIITNRFYAGIGSLVAACQAMANANTDKRHTVAQPSAACAESG